ncbi:hypothetical protein B0H21DRAFT_820483 [Amylocystis lapponica]|nr:hypothetical protein B0H21DRAFT_828080 [Amylocystis lapponica]KAH9949125.1 hypothetical protein B0H21DRAFT_820483 [Amylocystis lapponica]
MSASPSVGSRGRTYPLLLERYLKTLEELDNIANEIDACSESSNSVIEDYKEAIQEKLEEVLHAPDLRRPSVKLVIGEAEHSQDRAAPGSSDEEDSRPVRPASKGKSKGKKTKRTSSARSRGGKARKITQVAAGDAGDDNDDDTRDNAAGLLAYKLYNLRGRRKLQPMEFRTMVEVPFEGTRAERLEDAIECMNAGMDTHDYDFWASVRVTAREDLKQYCRASVICDARDNIVERMAVRSQLLEKAETGVKTLNFIHQVLSRINLLRFALDWQNMTAAQRASWNNVRFRLENSHLFENVDPSQHQKIVDENSLLVKKWKKQQEKFCTARNHMLATYRALGCFVIAHPVWSEEYFRSHNHSVEMLALLKLSEAYDNSFEVGDKRYNVLARYQVAVEHAIVHISRAVAGEEVSNFVLRFLITTRDQLRFDVLTREAVAEAQMQAGL